MSDGPLPNPIAIAEFGNFGKYGMRDEKVADNVSEKHGNIEYDTDGIHDGLVFPTEEERATLRRVPDSIPWDAYRKPSFRFLPCCRSSLNCLQSSRLLNWPSGSLFVVHFFIAHFPKTKDITSSSTVLPSSS